MSLLGSWLIYLDFQGKISLLDLLNWLVVIKELTS